MNNRHRSIWFALLTLLLVSLYRKASKVSKILVKRLRGAENDSSGG